MSRNKIAFTFLISLAFTGVAAWTIDLPEARKYFFEKAEEHSQNKKDEQLKDFNEEQKFFDNIVPDSPHNKDQLELIDDHHLSGENERENDVYGGRYADEYEYMSYMEKKVNGIVHNGSIYLEGLRRALEDYGDLLKNCSRYNFTQPQSTNGPWLPENERPSYSQNPTSGPNQPISGLNQPISGPNQPISGPNQPNSGPNQFNPNSPNFNNQQGSVTRLPNGFFNQTSLSFETCERATRAREHVRRLAELALWATRELQDRAYAEKYEKQSPDEEEEEMELLLRLAFFLDRLAYLTGFEPEPKDYITPKPIRSTTTQAPPFSMMGDIPDDVKKLMMECLRSNSSEPATERCRYPLQHPEFIRRLFNVTDSPDRVQPVSTESYEPKNPSLPEVLRNPSQRPLTLRRIQKRDILTAVKRQTGADRLTVINRQIRSIDRLLGADSENSHDHAIVNSLKSSEDHPMIKVMKYYVKHKVWTNSNPESISTDETSGEFDVPNQLTDVTKLSSVKRELSSVKSIKKRAIDEKKSKHMRLPEDPFQDLSNFVKHKKGVNYVKKEDQSEKIKQYLDKIRHSDRARAKILVKKLQKSLRQKRSIKYENKFLPEPSQNPRQDISYYVKNKEGTEYQNNLIQAAQVRAGLEEIFQNPNIEVVRRYGTNFNPLIPFPLAAGLARSFYLDL